MKCLLTGKMKAFRAAREKIPSARRRGERENKRRGICAEVGAELDDKMTVKCKQQEQEQSVNSGTVILPDRR